MDIFHLHTLMGNFEAYGANGRYNAQEQNFAKICDTFQFLEIDSQELIHCALYQKHSMGEWREV